MKRLVILVALVTVVLPACLMGDDWAPITPAELALKQAVVEPGADAEAFFWEVRVKDELDSGGRTVSQNYLRIKIFTERGRETHGTVELRYSDPSKVKDIEARTIKPDGTILLLKKDGIFDREVARTRGAKMKAKSFALPGVEPGSIIEYRWKEERGWGFYNRLACQQSFPIQRVSYYILPLKLHDYGMSIRPFNVAATPLKKVKEGYFLTEVFKVPAFKAEPRMPPEHQVRKWILLFYTDSQNMSPEQYWKTTGKRVYEDAKWMLRQNDDVRQKAQSLTAGAATPEEKIKRLFDFCQTEIKNSDDDASFTPDQRAKLKENNSPSDTLKRQVGTGWDILVLFGSLARACGFDARWARLPDRGDLFFDRNFLDARFSLTTYDVAIKIGDEWRFYDPGSTYVEFGMLRWQEEGVTALVSDPKEPFWITTPLSSASRTAKRRTATLKLSEDGTLEGDVVMEYTGHVANSLKEEHDAESPTEREQSIKDLMTERMSTAEVTKATIENANCGDKTLTYSFHVRVPDYAQKTGKRIFFQPGFFQKGIELLFTATQRRYPLYFQYPWIEEDKVTIELPEGYELETSDPPAPLSAGESAQYEVKIGVDGRTLKMERNFAFHGLFYQVDQYVPLKRLFETLHARDNVTLTLRQGPSTATD
jgi:hypothetical protein